MQIQVSSEVRPRSLLLALAEATKYPMPVVSRFNIVRSFAAQSQTPSAQSFSKYLVEQYESDLPFRKCRRRWLNLFPATPPGIVSCRVVSAVPMAVCAQHPITAPARRGGPDTIVERPFVR